MDTGGNYESLAFDDRDPTLPTGQYYNAKRLRDGKAI